MDGMDGTGRKPLLDGLGYHLNFLLRCFLFYFIFIVPNILFFVLSFIFIFIYLDLRIYLFAEYSIPCFNKLAYLANLLTLSIQWLP